MYKKVYQRSLKDCGVACLLSIIRYYKGDNTFDNIKKLARCNNNGITALNLIEASTKLGFNAKGLKCQYEDLDTIAKPSICHIILENGYNHYEVSNFCKDDTYSKHNMVYWKNNEYYGFGIGASGYVNSIRYDNTRSMYNYCNGNYVINSEKLNVSDKISYELILGFRLINGINKKEFEDKYGLPLIEQYNICKLIKDGLLIDDGLNVKVSYDKIYIENVILENFV